MCWLIVIKLKATIIAIKSRTMSCDVFQCVKKNGKFFITVLSLLSIFVNIRRNKKLIVSIKLSVGTFFVRGGIKTISI